MTKSLLAEDVKSIRIFSRDELKQADMARQFSDPRMRFFLGDVRDRDRLEWAFFGADLVIHAAAMKRVDACEYNPTEAVQTNIVGAMNVVTAAQKSQVRRVVALSTDKAAAPLTLYGATKLALEKVINAGNAYGANRTEFLCVRYGNVVGSRGSLIPALQGPSADSVTITDPACTRFWMTLGEAVALVRRAMEWGKPGTVLIPQLHSVRVVDVFEAVLGKTEIAVTGMRGAEKVHESLISADEAPNAWRWMSNNGVVDYILGLPEAPGIEGPYDSGANGRFLTVEEIRERIPAAMAEAGW